MRGETARLLSLSTSIEISIHSPHARGDSSPLSQRKGVIDFNPLPSCEGRRCQQIFAQRRLQFQSTPLMRGETKMRRTSANTSIYFNPLPSCEGRRRYAQDEAGRYNFNPLPSCEGRRKRVHGVFGFLYFNPLPSCEGRLFAICKSSPLSQHFNPLPSCEGRQHKPLKIRLDSRQFIQQNHHSSFF